MGTGCGSRGWTLDFGPHAEQDPEAGSSPHTPLCLTHRRPLHLMFRAGAAVPQAPSSVSSHPEPSLACPSLACPLASLLPVPSLGPQWHLFCFQGAALHSPTFPHLCSVTRARLFPLISNLDEPALEPSHLDC